MTTPDKTPLALVLTTLRWILACPDRTANTARLAKIAITGAAVLAGLAAATAAVIALVLHHADLGSSLGTGLAGAGAGAGITTGIGIARQRRHQRREHRRGWAARPTSADPATPARKLSDPDDTEVHQHPAAVDRGQNGPLSVPGHVPPPGHQEIRCPSEHAATPAAVGPGSITARRQACGPTTLLPPDR
jgi:hypothetical protein